MSLVEPRMTPGLLEVGEEFYRRLVDESSSTVLVYDADTRIIYANRPWLEHWNTSLEEVRGQRLLDLSNPAEQERFEKRLEQLRRLTPENPLLTLDFRPALPGIDWLSVSYQAWYDDDGEFLYYSATGRDRSQWWRAEVESKDANRRLAERNRDLEDFAASASHDLQEPLRKIRAFSDRLTSTNADALDDRGRDYLSRISASAGRMQQLIDDVLTLSRVASPTSAKEPVDLADVLAEVVDDLEIAIEESDARIEIGDLPTLSVDVPQIRLVFQNLLSNAIKFRVPGRPLRIAIEAERVLRPRTPKDRLVVRKRGWAITVRDNGIGFDQEHGEAVFGMFHRLNSRSDYPGSGIGLSICRRIVERHDGELFAESTPGEGSTFTIWLA